MIYTKAQYMHTGYIRTFNNKCHTQWWRNLKELSTEILCACAWELGT